MKRKFLIIVALLLLITFVCIFIFTRNGDKNILSNTWKQLEEIEKNELENYKEGTVEIVQIPNAEITSNTFSYDENYIDKKVYLVTFTSKRKDLLGDVCKLVDINTGKIIGYNLRD